MDKSQPVGKYWIAFVIAAIVQLIFLIWIRGIFLADTSMGAHFFQ